MLTEWLRNCRKCIKAETCVNCEALNLSKSTQWLPDLSQETGAWPCARLLLLISIVGFLFLTNHLKPHNALLIKHDRNLQT